jgi:DNA repair protein RadA/Sms
VLPFFWKLQTVSRPSRTSFVCQQCGKESLKWLGRCPGCQGWGTFVETRVSSSKAVRSAPSPTQRVARELFQVTAEETPRLLSPFSEFNRVLGGGIVPGSLVLISGDPGIGKSTLLLQVSAGLTGQGGKVVYASGEESPYQTRLRADRLGIRGEGLYLLHETDLEIILDQMEALSPALGVIDSIQTVYLGELEGAPGSVSQVRECTLRLMQWAKLSNTPLLITGHVTKEGAIAGPKVLEHIVDVVSYMEGESFSAYRLLRGIKNRFGSTNDVGIFEMRGNGLVEVEDPSRVFLAQRSQGGAGSVVAPVLEGSRPLLVEIQALTSITSYGLPRRTANGIDPNRLQMIVAVLTKRAGLRLSNQDIIVNVVGGLKVNEPAVDLAIALSIASSFSDREIAPDLVAVGEIGLSGEVRAVAQLERRLTEARRQGFSQCVGPGHSLGSLGLPSGMETLGADSLREALQLVLKRKSRAVAPTPDE